MTYDTTNIRVIQHSDNDEFAPTLDPAFVVLGMINEYVGRQAIEGGDTVEGFFPDERPVADLFATYLLLYAPKLSIDSPKISVNHALTGHSYVESKRMNDQVNALYRFEYPDDQVITMLSGQQLRCAHVALGVDDFPKKRSMLYEPEAMNARFSYMHGVLLRYGREDGLIRIANASEKVKLLQQVLVDLDVHWISHRYSVGGAPVATRCLSSRVRASLASSIVREWNAPRRSRRLWRTGRWTSHVQQASHRDATTMLRIEAMPIADDRHRFQPPHRLREITQRATVAPRPLLDGSRLVWPAQSPPSSTPP